MFTTEMARISDALEIARQAPDVNMDETCPMVASECVTNHERKLCYLIKYELALIMLISEFCRMVASTAQRWCFISCVSGQILFTLEAPSKANSLYFLASCPVIGRCSQLSTLNSSNDEVHSTTLRWASFTDILPFLKNDQTVFKLALRPSQLGRPNFIVRDIGHNWR